MFCICGIFTALKQYSVNFHKHYNEPKLNLNKALAIFTSSIRYSSPRLPIFTVHRLTYLLIVLAQQEIKCFVGKA